MENIGSMQTKDQQQANPFPGSYLLTINTAQRGYHLSSLCRSLMEPNNREAFKNDDQQYMRDYGLTEQEIAMVSSHDWLAVARYGVNHFLVFRLAAMYGDGLTATGAQMRGETHEQFQQTRRVWE